MSQLPVPNGLNSTNVYQSPFEITLIALKRSCDSCVNETIWPQLLKEWITRSAEKKPFIGQLKPIPIELSSEY